MEIIEIIASAFGITSAYLTVRKNIYCWHFAIVSFILYAYFFYSFGMYGNFILQLIFVAQCSYAIYVWSSDIKTHHDEIRIFSSHLSNGLMIMIGCAVFGYYGLCLKLGASTATMLDGTTAILAITATILSIYKYVDCWRYYIASDIIYVLFFLHSKHYVSMVYLSALTVMACYGWYEWKKMLMANHQEVLTANEETKR